MRKLYILTLVLCFASVARSQNVNVNPGGGTYPDLASAFAAVNAGTHTGSITIDIVGNTAEPVGGAVLNASGVGSASYTAILIRPSGGAARSIIGATTAGLPMIDFNGADNVTVDGLNTGGNSLTIENTTVSATAGTSTIRFIDGATSNTITNCFLKGAGTMNVATDGAVVFFSTDAVTANGNDNNTISNCDIGPSGANLPTKAILGNGSTTTTAIGNSGITINNNDIHDYFGAAVASAGIATNGGCNTWSITNNRFYQTGTRTWTTGALHNAINIANTSATSGAQGFTITGNIVGYSSNAQTGTYTLTGSTGKFQGIVFNGITGATVSNINSNTIASVSLTGVTSSGTSTSSPFAGIIVVNGLANTNSNIIGSQAAYGSLIFATTTTSSTEIYGIFNFSVDDWTSNTNNIGGIQVANNGASGTFIFYGMRANTSASKVWNAASNNVGGTNSASIELIAKGATQVVGMQTPNAISTLTLNNIRNLISNGFDNTGTASVTGILISTSTNNQTVSQNTISNLSNVNNLFPASVITGIQFTGGTGNVVERNLITNLTVAADGATAEVNGIRVGGGTTIYRNNMIAIGTGIAWALGGAATNTATTGINGINEALGTNSFFHNSVYIGGTPSSGTGASYAFNGTQTTNTRSFRDNIFFNARSNSGATGKHYAVKINGTAPNPAGLTINNNIYFANGTGGVLGFFNSLDVANLAAWKTAVGQDAGSFESNPQYIDPTNATPDLHLHPTNATAAEGNGVDVGVTNDYDGQTRASFTPTDIGADAGNFVGLDLAPPAITYTTLGNTSLTTNRTIAVTITDNTGVATGGGLEPRIYYKKNTGGYFSTAATLASGTIQNGVWTCTIDNAQVGGVVATDVISYFVVAQDIPSNLGANPSGGFSGTNVNSVTTPPTTPDQYTIAAAFSGTIPVGSTETFTSLTNTGGIFDAINNGVLTGNVTINLTSDLIAELGTVALNQWAEDGAGNYTLLIKPSGAPRTITGTINGALVRLNGADRVTIDGSTSGATAGTCEIGGNAAIRDLTITNTNVGTSAGVISIATGVNGAQNNTVKNVNILGQDPNTTLIGIAVGGNTFGTIGADNDNVTIDNCSVRRAIFGIYNAGASAANRNTGSKITRNDLSATTTNRIKRVGIMSFNNDGIEVSYNSIGGIETTESVDAIGIALGTQSIDLTITTSGEVVNALVANNKINGVASLNTTGFSAAGITVAGGNAGANTIRNNMITGVTAPSTSPDLTAGIYVVGATGADTRLYYNSVSMTGDRGAVATQTPSYGIAITGSNPTVDLRNNILYTTQIASGGGVNAKSYAIGMASNTFTNLNSNYNAFWSIGANDGGFRTGSLDVGAGTSYATLAAWQTAVSNDANSVEADPLFNDPLSDLHLTTFEPLATPIAGITNDYDCQTRSASTPDIGADEIVNAVCTLSLTSAVGTNAQTVCLNTAITNITYSNTAALGATGATFGGLPTGVTGSWSGDAVTISGSPSVGGTFNYTVTLVGGTCAGVTANGTITVNANPTVSISPASLSLCIGASLNLTATAGLSTYSWSSSGGTFTSTTNEATLSNPASGGYSFTVTATNTNSCTATATASATVNPSPTRLYVNASATGANTGLTWTDAFTDLQSALNYSCNANLTEIWVAKGTYYPTADASGNTSPTDARTKTFVMKNGVAIYGGFSGDGSETLLSQRNQTTNPTILSGDIDKNNTLDNGNSYHVIYNNYTSITPLTSTSVLDGFTITGGRANGSGFLSSGGGMYNFNSSPSITNCSFFGNSADQTGGGMYNFNSSPSITNCSFSGNSANQTGGGISNIGNASIPNPSITNCSFTGNSAVQLGGGIYNGSASPSITNCTFSGNSSPGQGGGMASTNPNINSSNPVVKNCIFWGNTSEIYTISPSFTAVTYSIVKQTSGVFSGTGNLNVDPLFVNSTDADGADNILGTADDGLRLQACSPAINVGTNTGAPTTDILGNPRPYVGAVSTADMGAYEYQGNPAVITINAPAVTQPTCATPTGTIVVNATGNGSLEYSIDNGSNWQNSATFSGLAAGNYYIKVRSQANPACITTYGSNPVTLTSPFTASTTTDTWTGCVSTDWNTAGNWADGSVPTANDNVTIPAAPSNQPIIGAGTAAVAKSVLINASASLTINATGSLAINGSSVHGLDNYGTLDNSGTIRVGNTTTIGAIGILHRNGGTFNNKPNGAIYIDRTGGSQAFYSNGLVNNEASIKIGSNAAITGEGMRVEGNTFNNKPGGAIYIDQTNSIGIRLLNSGTIFNNENLIEIGSTADVQGNGIRNNAGCTFNNKAGGDIKINRIGIANTGGIPCIINFGTFNNDAKITTGNGVLLYAQDGIYNAGTFSNTATGIISIAKPRANGIWNSAGTFQNAGKITISNVFDSSDGTYSTGILSTTSFSNSLGAEIHIDQVGSGIITTNAFSNAGLIRMGENGALTGSGISNIQGVNAVFNNNAGGDISIKQTAVDGVQNDPNSTFNNNACAKLTMFDNLNNAGTFTNTGLFTVNTAQAHTNTALTNNGVIAYPQGNPIPNVTNNDVIVGPITVCGTTASPALQIGGGNSFTAGSTWYSDQGLSTAAGTYDQNTNTFTNLSLSGTQTLYFSINDASNSCPRTVSIQVTVNAGGPIIYVTQTGAGLQNGSSWANALPSTQLQYAINSAAICTAQVWVAKGTYYPTADASGNTSPADARTKTFVMKNGVAIYGGFVGNEAANYDLSLRNFTSNETILSGDIDGIPDVVTGSGSTLSISGNGGNVYHVFSNASGLTNTAILDGFTVSGGNANGTNPHNNGGGMLNDGSGAGKFCSPTIRNCTFTHNYASGVGGGIHNRGADGNSSPQISNCTFLANIGFTYGGGIAHSGTGTTSYTNCDFNYNNSTTGGAIFYSTSAGNTATHSVLNCNFTGNAAYHGGAISGGLSYETGTRTVSLTNCTFTDNRATFYGGAFNNGFQFTAGSTPVFFTNCIFKNNLAHNGSTIGSGGAYQSQGGLSSQTATFTNCLLDGNKAMGTTDDGGGAIMIYSGTVTLINSTVVNSQTATRGGVVSIYNNTGAANIKNSIFWNNTATSFNSIFIGAGGSASAQYSLLQDASCPANVTCGAGMLYNQDPLFVNLAGGNLRLQGCSPALNVGDNTANSTTTDLDGNSRKFGVIDMGAYEYQGNVIAPPTATASTTTSSVCQGNTINLSATGGDNYSWTGPTGSNFSSTQQNPSFTASSTAFSGIYTVVVSNANCAATATATVSVTVNALPTISVTIPPAQCGGTINLNTVFSSNGALSYFTDSGFSSAAANPVSSGGPYYAKALDATTSCSVTASVSVTINTSATISVTTPSAQCGGTINLSTAFSSNGTLSYFTDSGFTSTSANPVAASGPYYAKASVGTCTNSASVSITINPLPTISVTIPPAQCGGTINLNTVFSSNGALSYFTDSGFSSAAANPVSSGGPYYAKALDATTSCSVTASVSVTINTSATISVTPPPAQCGGTINLSTAFSSNGTLSYFTDSGFTSTSANPVTASGPYYAKASVGTCTNSASVSITINPLPTISVTIPPAQCGGTINLNTVFNSNGSLTFFTDSGFSSAVTNPVSSGGPYYATALDATTNCSVTASVSVTINTSATISVTTPSAQCGGTINLSTAFSSNGTLSYFTDSGFTSTSANPVAASGPYYAKASVGTCTNSASVSITINPLPTLNISPNNSQLCASQSLSLSATAGLTGYSWSKSGGTFGSSNNLPTISFSSSTPSNFTLTVTASNGSCSASASALVLVNGQVIPLVSSNAPLCTGTTLNLSVDISGASYTWRGPGFTSTEQNPSRGSFSTSMIGVYSITVSNSLGCSGTGTVNVQAKPSPTPQVSSNSPLCAGNTLQLSASGGSSYSWRAPDGFSSAEQNPARASASASMSGGYSLTVTNSNGCTASNTLSVSVQAAALSASPNPLGVCLGQTINLSANASPAASAFSWKGPGNFSSTTQSISTYATTTANLGIYSVSATIGSCVVTSTAEVKSGAVLQAGVVGLPCVGGTIQFTASGMTSYTWSRPTNNFNSTLQNPVIPSSTMNDAGVYFLSARSGSCFVSMLVPVMIAGTGISPSFSVTPSSFAAGATVSLSAASASGVYSWSGPNGFSGNTRTKTISNFQVVNNGIYRLTLTVGTCTGYTEQTISVNTATRLAAAEPSEEAIGLEINAYPNPVTHMLTVEVRLKEPSALQLNLVNSVGKPSGAWQLNEVRTFHKTELNLSDLQGGVYLLQAQAGKQKVVKRVVKIQY